MGGPTLSEMESPLNHTGNSHSILYKNRFTKLQMCIVTPVKSYPNQGLGLNF